MLFGILNSFLLIYLAAAVVPAIVLMVYIYKKDTVEREPVKLVASMMVYGALSAVLAMGAEMIAEKVLNIFVDVTDPHYVIFFAFLAVAAVEEGLKFFFLKRKVWNEPNFDHRFDGIVYAAAISLGFAAFENIGYVFSYGLSVAPARAFLSIPGHLSFAVYMGALFGHARLWENRNYHGKAVALQIASYLSAVFLHGFYDTCAMTESGVSGIVFFVFVAAMFASVFFIVKREAERDRPLN